MKTIFISAMLTFSVVATTDAQQLPVYLDETKPVEQRIDDALLRMTLQEKIAAVSYTHLRAHET